MLAILFIVLQILRYFKREWETEPSAGISWKFLVLFC